jgi:nitrate reductase NapE component
MSTTRLPTWVSVLIAAVIIVGVLAVAAVGGAAFFIYRHVNTTFTPSENAEVEFSESRARFGGQRPLIELRHDDDPIVHRELLKEGTPKHRLDALRVLAYDEHARKLVRVSIPFWLLRMAPSKHLSFLNDNGINVDVDSDRVRLTLDDLERRGPGLLLDTRDRRGSQVLVWTE